MCESHMLNTYKRHQLEAQIHKPYHVFLFFYISHLYMDTNKPLHLVLVVLTKLHATGETPGFKKQLRPSLCSCQLRPRSALASRTAALQQQSRVLGPALLQQGRKVSFPLEMHH